MKFGSLFCCSHTANQLHTFTHMKLTTFQLNITNRIDKSEKRFNLCLSRQFPKGRNGIKLSQVNEFCYTFMCVYTPATCYTLKHTWKWIHQSINFSFATKFKPVIILPIDFKNEISVKLWLATVFPDTPVAFYSFSLAKGFRYTTLLIKVLNCWPLKKTLLIT